MNFKDFFDFEKFLTPSLVKIVYWAGLLGIVLVVLSSIFAAYGDGGNLILLLLGGIFLIVGGCILWRVLCEGIILTFKMYDRITEVRDRLPRK